MKTSKRVLVIFILCIAVSFTGISRAFATKDIYDPKDSLTISEEVTEKLNVMPHEHIIRMYHGSIMFAFSKGMKLDDILIDNEMILQEIYMIAPIVKGSNITVVNSYKAETDGKFHTLSVRGYWHDTDIYMNVIFPEKVFDKASLKVEVENVYLLTEADPHPSAYIYYKTDRGDYVYFRENIAFGKEYLFTADEFYDFAKVVMENETQNCEPEDIKSGDNKISYENVYDMGKYDLSIMNQNRIIKNILFIGISVIAVALIICGALLMRKKAKKSNT